MNTNIHRSFIYFNGSLPQAEHSLMKSDVKSRFYAGVLPFL